MANPYIQHQGKKTRFKPGVSGNPAGRPKGSKNFKTIIRKMIHDPNFDWSLLDVKNSKQLKTKYKTVGEVIAYRMMVEAMNGNVKAANWLNKMTSGK